MQTLHKKLVVPGVWDCLEQFPRFSMRDVEECIAAIGSSPTRRARVCMHTHLQDRMQEMFIAFEGKSYVRPSFHVDKDESFHMLEGLGKYVFFDAEGTPLYDVRLGPYASDLPFYCRIPGNVSHSLIVYSEYAMAHEVVTGPFSRESTVFPSWSPDLQTEEEKAHFRAHHAYAPVSPLLGCAYDRITEEMCRAKPGVVSVSRADLAYLKLEVYKTTRKRIRLCVHQNDEALLHEMFVVYTGMTYVRPNLHLGKDKSLHVLEGEADFVFFDDTGHVIDVIHLGERSSGKDFFVRVPQGIFHTIIMRSEHMVLHEATPGPFKREETVWAPWAPSDSDPTAVAQFQNTLESKIKELS